MSKTIIHMKRALITTIAIFLGVIFVTIPYAATWEIGVLESTGDSGKHCNLQVDASGNLHVAYLRSDDGTLNTMSQVGGVWQTPVVVDSDGSVEGFCGLTVDASGECRFSYRRTDTNALWYAGPEIVPQWLTGTVSAIGDAGAHCDLQTNAAGVYCCAYLQNDEGKLKVVSNIGGIWQTPQTVDTSGAVTGYCGVSVDPSGEPRLSYRRDDTNTLWYAGSEIAPRWALGIVADEEDSGSFCDLKMDSLSNMWVAYLQNSGKKLNVATSSGDVWNTPVTVDSSGTVAGYCGLHVSGDTPRISYRRDDENTLWYAGPELAPRWLTGTIITPGDAGRYVSFTKAPDNRLAGVFYRYVSGGTGSIAMVAIENGEQGAVRTVVDSVGTSATDGIYTSLAVGSDGRWHISYRNAINTDLYYVSADTVITGVWEAPDKPATVVYTFELSQNYPNPFNPRTTIKYSLNEKVLVTLEIYDVAGRMVRRLVKVVQGPGSYSVRWNGINNFGDQVSSGIYFYKLQAGDRVLTKKMVLLK